MTSVNAKQFVLSADTPDGPVVKAFDAKNQEEAYSQWVTYIGKGIQARLVAETDPVELDVPALIEDHTCSLTEMRAVFKSMAYEWQRLDADVHEALMVMANMSSDLISKLTEASKLKANE